MHLFGFYWAARGGFNNITDHANVAVAYNTIDPRHPAPTFIDTQGRSFDFRIRLFGRK